MVRRIGAVLVAAAVLGMAAPAAAQFAFPAPVPTGEDFTVEIGMTVWRPTPNLRLAPGAAEPDEDPADLVPLLNLERRRLTEVRLALKPGRKHRFRFGYLPMHLEQETAATAPFSFGSATFAEGEAVAADLRWDQWRVGYQYDLASTERALFGVLLDVRRTRIVADLQGEGQGDRTEEQITVPVVGFVARGYLHRSVGVGIELSGFGVPGLIGRWITDDDLDITTRDLDFHVLANASRHLGIQGGYRRVRSDFRVEALRGDLKASGWYGGVFLRF